MNALPGWNRESLPGPENTTRVFLTNGITLLARSNPNSPSVSISGYVACGSVFDPPELIGLAHYTASTLMRGTARRSFQQIYAELEAVGASLGFGASVHNTSFGGRGLAEDLPLLLELLAECLASPTFPDEYIERTRAMLLTSLAIRDQDTSTSASLKFDSLLFPGHPYGTPEDGFPETIQKITRTDIADFHRRNVGPRGMALVLVGGMDTQQACQLAEEALGGWQNPSQPDAPPMPEIQPTVESMRQHIHIPGKSQADLVMGSLGPRRNAPDYLAASLGNNILGQFGMMGRIGDVVREKAGLAYHASTSLNSWIHGGSWEVSAGVAPENLEPVIALIMQELRRFVCETVQPEELADSQANYIGRLPLSLESNAGVAGALLNLERFQLGLDYYQRYAGLVEAVTPDEILETARHYLDLQRLVIVSAGTMPNGTSP